MEVNKEIEEMLSDLGDPTPEDLKQGEEEDKEEEKQEEDNEESKDPENEEKEEDKEEDEYIEPDDKDKIIENLRNQLNERIVPPKEKGIEGEEKEEKKEEPIQITEQDFIGDLDLDDLTRDKGMFNKLLNAVYSKGVNDSKKLATEGVLMTIPDIVKHNVNLITSLAKTREEFYSENEDLMPYEGVVAVVFEELAAKNPDKKYNEILKEVAPEVRKRLALSTKAKELEKKGNPPRLPSSKGGPRSIGKKPETSALEKELDEMNTLLRR